jgi:hypothetical protein
MGFAEPSRSPGLLVSSYLAVSPLPRSRRREATRPRRSIFCGTVPIRVAFADPDGGRYPPSRPVESGLSSVARPRAQVAGRVSPPCSLSSGAPAIIAPVTNSPSSYGGPLSQTTRGDHRTEPFWAQIDARKRAYTIDHAKRQPVWSGGRGDLGVNPCKTNDSDGIRNNR